MRDFRSIFPYPTVFLYSPKKIVLAIVISSHMEEKWLMWLSFEEVKQKDTFRCLKANINFLYCTISD